MNEVESIIDLKFGLAQLGGNQDLLVKLLTKFQAQNADLADKLDTLIASNDKESAAGIIHTVKGVSGNLGLSALHVEAKRLETSLYNGSIEGSGLAEFESVLSKTFIEIATLSQQPVVDEPVEKDGISKLQDSLRNNEYVPSDKVNNYLNQGSFSQDQIKQIIQAIDELDYPKALTLLTLN